MNEGSQFERKVYQITAILNIVFLIIWRKLGALPYILISWVVAAYILYAHRRGGK